MPWDAKHKKKRKKKAGGTRVGGGVRRKKPKKAGGTKVGGGVRRKRKAPRRRKKAGFIPPALLEVGKHILIGYAMSKLGALGGGATPGLN